MATLFNYEIYETADGLFSFRINGAESHYQSSGLDSLQKTIHTLQRGAAAKKATVTLPTVKGKGADTTGAALVRELVRAGAAQLKLKPEQMAAVEATLAKTPVPDTGPNWSEHPTEAERVAAFLRRGKLGAKSEE